MLSHYRDFSQLALTLDRGCPLHAWLTSVNGFIHARYPNEGYTNEARGGMHWHSFIVAVQPKLLHLQQCG